MDETDSYEVERAAVMKLKGRAAGDVWIEYVDPAAIQLLINAAEERGRGRLFSMQHGPSIPWWLAEVIYAGYASRYGKGQSLEQMHARHGFGWAEVESMWDDRHDAYRMRRAMVEAEAALRTPTTKEG